MAIHPEMCLVSMPEEVDTRINLSRAEFRKLMEQVDDDYVDPDFAGMKDWPGANVKRRAPMKLAPALTAQTSINGAPVTSQQSKLKSQRSPSGHSINRIFTETLSGVQLKRRSTRVLQQDDEGDPTDGIIPQFHGHFEKDKKDHHKTMRDSVPPHPVPYHPAQSNGQYAAESRETPFSSSYHKTLTGNEFYDRRHPQGFNLVHSVQKSFAAYCRSHETSQSRMQAAGPRKPGLASSSSPTLPFVNSTPSKKAPSHRRFRPSATKRTRCK